MQAEAAERKFEKRTSDRVKLTLQGGVRKSGCNRVPATITSLSSFGCSLEGVINLRVDQTVWVRMAGLEGQAAKIRWTAPGVAGLSFIDPIHAAVLNSICNLRTPPAP